jgi:hypothetical protein
MKQPPTNSKKRKASKQKLPRGWDEQRIRKVLAHYENQTDEEAAAEDDAAFAAEGQTAIVVPTDLVPAILKLIARHDRQT